MKFGLIGIGGHVKKNILPIAADLNNTFVSAFSPNKEKLEALKLENGLSLYNSKELFLKSNEFNTIYIASPNSTHYQLAKEALLNYKHVVVEKTSFTSLKEAKEVIKIAKSKNLLIQEAFMYRYHPQLEHLKETIRKIGNDEMSAEINFCIPKLEDTNIRYSLSLGGGALNDTGAYIIDIVRSFFNFTHNDINDLSIKKKENEVDMSGSLKFKKGKQVISCKWSLEGEYKNSLRLKSREKLFFYPRIFSKDVNELAEVHITKKDKVDKFFFKKSNHFKSMFSNVKDNDAYKTNQANELRSQAEFMEEIRSHF